MTLAPAEAARNTRSAAAQANESVIAMSSYQIFITDNILTLKTSSFKAEKGSILDSGIYNREFASILAAGSIMLLALFFFAIKARLSAVNFFTAFSVFILLFFFFRRVIFRETHLEAAFDRTKRRVNISLSGIIKKNRSYSMDDIVEIRQGHIRINPTNEDGIRLVEQIALHHGSVMPGFGMTSEFYTVDLLWKDNKTITLFSSEDKDEADYVLEKFREFVGDINA
ncbi:MAG: hypothetical protein L0Y62_03035 [Nitrospirae bacterium]|nr:hypothetical protein [Nitrospirota bacterium]